MWNLWRLAFRLACRTNECYCTTNTGYDTYDKSLLIQIYESDSNDKSSLQDTHCSACNLSWSIQWVQGSISSSPQLPSTLPNPCLTWLLSNLSSPTSAQIAPCPWMVHPSPPWFPFEVGHGHWEALWCCKVFGETILHAHTDPTVSTLSMLTSTDRGLLHHTSTVADNDTNRALTPSSQVDHWDQNSIIFAHFREGNKQPAQQRSGSLT